MSRSAPRPLYFRLPSGGPGLAFVTPSPVLGARLGRGYLGSPGTDLAIRSNARVALMPFSNGGAREQVGSDGVPYPSSACVVEGSTVRRLAEPLRPAALGSRLERLVAPKAERCHGRAASA
jgi:hypothetical protein